MRTIVFILVSLISGVVSAQEVVTAPHAEATVPPQPSPAATVALISASSGPSREAPPQILPDVQEEGPSVSPTPPALPGVQQLDEAFRESSLGQEADEARLHVQWRDLVNRTVNDPDLVAARAYAEAAPTDLEKRNRLRVYYASYFGRLKARARSVELRTYLQAREDEHLAALSQPKVRPGIGIVGSPTPTPSTKKKFKKPSEPDLPH